MFLQGDYLNDLCVLNTGSNTWTATSVVGELPEPRSDTQVTNLVNTAVYSTGNHYLALLIKYLVDACENIIRIF